MCVYVCLATSGKTGQLVLAETLEGSDAVVEAEERGKKPASPPSHLTAPAGTRTGGHASLPEPPRKDFSTGIFFLRACLGVEEPPPAAMRWIIT